MVFKKQSNATAVLARLVKDAFALATIALITLITPTTAHADNTATHTNHFTNPNWQNMNHTENWNWQHNWAYHPPQYQFQSTFPVDQWGRPTSSNIAAQNTPNIRRDRHAAFLPPGHGTVTGFFSGEFPTGQVNPFAPRYNNNPDASHAVIIAGSPFALLPSETGVNVQSQASHSGGFLANTSMVQGGLGSDNVNNPASNHTPSPSWINPTNQTPISPNQVTSNAHNASADQSGFSVTHRPMQPPQTNQSPTQSTTQSTNQASSRQTTQSNRITTVTPFSNGTIGRITFPTLNNRVAYVRTGLALPTLDHYVGHFTGTSQWDGNISLASHNQGPGSFFAGIWNMRYGDRIYYETTMGMRVFEIVSIHQISESDLSNLDHSHENILTLVTCVAGQPSLRWSVRAVEIA
ncbi:MAG: sortase [Defluviitaleaceae bacterium]|nr:sortase [Defluviitaleaceae bacterium]